MSTLEIALDIANKAHAGQKDRDGEAYILHPLQVGLMGDTDEERCAGFLHDVLEDSKYTADNLLEAGIPKSVVTAVELLTHKTGTNYQHYIQQIIDSNNPIAIRVKYNDLKHNFQRGKAYPDLQKKHGEALQKVEECMRKMNECLEFVPETGLSTAIFAAGCFWGVQHYFENLPGVKRTFVGFCGGQEAHPTYEAVRQHKTTHVEAIAVEYDSNQVKYIDLCKLFFEIHDPEQTDGQGPDKGEQYRSAVFFHNNEELEIIHKLVAYLQKQGQIVNTMILPASTFWMAENYHQHYYARTGGNPYCHVRVRKFKNYSE